MLVKFGVQIKKIKLKLTNLENLVLWDRDVIDNGPIELKLGTLIEFGMEILNIKLKIANLKDLVLWDRDIIENFKTVKSS